MLDARLLIQALEKEGINFYTGVPCSLLGEVFYELENTPKYIASTIEGEALAMTAGAWLAGQEGAVFCQNSGLGNMVNVLTSLNKPAGIPAMLFIGWRGEPDSQDEPQHKMMGMISEKLLDIMGVTYWILSQNPKVAYKQIRNAACEMRKNRSPVAFLVQKNTFEHKSIPPRHLERETLVFKSSTRQPQALQIEIERKTSRLEMLETVLQYVPREAAIVATTGMCGRELFTLEDSDHHFYLSGAMGSASAVGLGIAANTKQPVFVLDGDGAAQMRLSTMALIGNIRPSNLYHVIFDNNGHGSTGGQRTAAPNLDYQGVAKACGYLQTSLCWSPQTMRMALASANKTPGPHLIHSVIEPNSPHGIGRPDIPPHQIARRIRRALET